MDSDTNNLKIIEKKRLSIVIRQHSKAHPSPHIENLAFPGNPARTLLTYDSMSKSLANKQFTVSTFLPAFGRKKRMARQGMRQRRQMGLKNCEKD